MRLPLGDRRLGLDSKIKGQWVLDYAIIFSGKEHIDQRKSSKEYYSWLSSILKQERYSVDLLDSFLRVKMDSFGFSLNFYVYYRTGQQYEMACYSEKWDYRDPNEYYTWITDSISQNGAQLSRIIRLFKQWYMNIYQGDITLPYLESSFLTILIVQNFSKSDNDDTAFKNTCATLLTKFRNVGVKCISPTTPRGLDFFGSLKNEQKERLMTNLEILCNTCTQALRAPSYKEAALKFGILFGNSFSTSIEKAQEQDTLLAQSTKSTQTQTGPAIISGPARSA